MNRKLLSLLALMLGSVCYPAKPLVLSERNQWKTIDYIQQTTPWLKSQNAAGMLSFKGSSVSEAQLSFNKNKGGFVNYNESDNSYDISAEAQSYFRFNDNVVVMGKIDYTYGLGKNMGGSFLIDPSSSPFDLLDFDGNNRGKKRKETYHILGGVGGKVNSKIILGGKFEYTTANYSKQKDLRHTNQLMDLAVSPSIIFKVTDNFDLGANYSFRKRNESMSFETFGTTDQKYNSLVSYGAFWGTKEQYGVNGYTNETDKEPLVDKYHGGNFQISWQLSKRISLLNEFAYKKRDGYYGIKSPSTVIYSEHKADIIANHTTLAIETQKSRHFIGVNFDMEKLDNFENIYRYDNDADGRHDVGYYGQNKVSNRKSINFAANYAAHFGLENNLPRWIIIGDYQRTERKVNATLYPYLRKQDITHHCFTLSGEMNLYKGINHYEFGLKVGLEKGSGNKNEDGSVVDTSEGSLYPQSADYALDQEFEYLTARQFLFGVQSEYSRKIKQTNLIGYCSINYNFAVAQDIQHLRDNKHHLLTLALGCRF